MARLIMVKVGGITAEPLVARLRTVDAVAFRFVLVDREGRIQRLNGYGRATRWAYAQEAAAITNCRRAEIAIGPTYIVTDLGVWAVEEGR